MSSASAALLLVVASVSVVVFTVGRLAPASGVLILVAVACLAAVAVIRLVGGVSLPLQFLIAVMLADLFLVDYDIGPASSRIYILGALVIWLYAEVATKNRSLFASPFARRVAILYAIFLVWGGLNDLYRGVAPAELAITMSRTTLVGVAAFLVFQAAVRTRRDLTVFASALALTIVPSAAIALAQWTGADWAWDLTVWLRPEGVTGGYVRGLARGSAALGAHLVVAAPLLVAWVLWRVPRTPLRFGLQVAAVSLVLITPWIALVRAALLAFAVILPVLAYQRLSDRSAQFSRGRTALLVIALTFVILAVFIGNEFRGSQKGPISARAGYYSLKRTTNPDATSRLALWSFALRSGMRHPLLGDENAFFQLAFPGGVRADSNLPNRVKQNPHNLFLSTLVRYGIPGTVFLMAFLAAVGAVAFRAVKVSRRDPVLRWISAGAALGLTGDLIVAQFGAGSFASGDVLPWWTVAMLVVIASGRLTGGPSGNTSKQGSQPTEVSDISQMNPLRVRERDRPRSDQKPAD